MTNSNTGAPALSIDAQLDLPAYLRRIGYAGDLAPSLAQLEALHLAHVTHIPFENLDILLGRAIRLDLGSLQAKLVRGGRGGYCFEHNLLFAAVLRTLGFTVTQLAARVRYFATTMLPRTHMLLRVDIDGAAWIADVGFGAEGLLLPVPIDPGRAVRHFAWTYRVIESAGIWTLQSGRDGAWMDLYAFTMEAQHAVDYEVANYYVSTHPASRFVQTLTAQLPTPEARHILRNREYIVDRGSSIAKQQLAGDAELLALLRHTFGLDFPDGTRFRFDDARG